eukprot:CAMPEP_0119305432 /NCGR_PEP_ID=MMETSP1333-20130426/6446_1 /TAXON_ID=418940 /ORGANISM="Scyphosphaera apsteinii, Strain RCC1455" /LENGTH=460 /DNA_ID=CAMNT_0007308523 /DNA_START=433 /DNA_END=1815 /DNA_ORIENTATION=+
MHKVYKALATTYVEEEALRLLREEWGYDSRDRETIGKQEFYDAMFELADVWAITSSASEYAGFLDKLLTFLSDGNDLIEDQNIAVGGGLPTVYTYMDADTGDNGEGAGISASVGTAASVGIAKAAAGRWRQSSSVYQVSALERRARQARTKVYHWRERQHAAVTIQRNARVQIIRMVMVGRKLLVKQADNEAEPLGKQGASIGSCFTRHVGPMPSTLSTSSHRSPIIYSSGACSVTRTRPAGAEAASDSLPFRSTPLCASALSLSFKLPPLSPPKRSYHKDTIEADKRLPAGYGVPLSGACPFAALSPLERPRIMLTPEEHLKGMTKAWSAPRARCQRASLVKRTLRPIPGLAIICSSLPNLQRSDHATRHSQPMSQSSHTQRARATIKGECNGLDRGNRLKMEYLLSPPLTPWSACRLDEDSTVSEAHTKLRDLPLQQKHRFPDMPTMFATLSHSHHCK